MSLLPKIKSTISAFLVGEEGKISKQAALSLGALLTATAVAATAMAAHSSTSQIQFEQPATEKGIHSSAHTSAGGGGCGCGVGEVAGSCLCGCQMCGGAW